MHLLSNDLLLEVLIKKAIENGDFDNRFPNDFIKNGLGNEEE